MKEIKHLSVHQWLRSAIPDSQQPTSPIGFLFLKLPPPPCAALLVKFLKEVSVSRSLRKLSIKDFRVKISTQDLLGYKNEHRATTSDRTGPKYRKGCASKLETHTAPQRERSDKKIALCHNESDPTSSK